jgi:hypothetical protein
VVEQRGQTGLAGVRFFKLIKQLYLRFAQDSPVLVLFAQTAEHGRQLAPGIDTREIDAACVGVGEENVMPREGACASGACQPLIVAGSGGASRAAFMTGNTLAYLEARFPEFKKRLFAVSTVSGSSLGAAAFEAGLVPARAEFRRRGQVWGPSIKGVDYNLTEAVRDHWPPAGFALTRRAAHATTLAASRGTSGWQGYQRDGANSSRRPNAASPSQQAEPELADVRR